MRKVVRRVISVNVLRLSPVSPVYCRKIYAEEQRMEETENCRLEKGKAQKNKIYPRKREIGV